MFTELAVLTAVFNGTMAAFVRESAAKKNETGGVPTDEWARLALRRAARGNPELALTVEGTRPLREPGASRALPRVAGIAIDKTERPRHDKPPGGALLRGMAKGGTHYREAYMTAKCVARGAGITVTVARAVPHRPIGETLLIIGSRILTACAAVGAEPMLLMDREFLSAESVAWLNASGAGWAMLCKNTPYARGRCASSPRGSGGASRPRGSPTGAARRSRTR